MKPFRRDQITPETRVDITGLHSQDAFVRTMKSFGWKLKTRPDGRRFMVRVSH
ncbi:MAG TPA: hypothetical protein PKH39_16315 [Woeseiaceae bacterium]|nr:hypothetical protein [Woeseiaceae bacterium]